MGYCDNPRSYYFGTEVERDFRPEECGLRRCGSCPYYYDPESDPVVQRSIYLLSKIKRVRAEIKAIKQAIKSAQDEEEKQLFEEILKDLEKEEENLEEQIREHREDALRSERPFPWY